MIETGRAVVFPWHCDHYNHMNTRHYLGFFDDAGAHMMQALGYSLELDGRGDIGWADVEQTIKYRKEVCVGALLRITSSFLEIGSKTIKYRHTMANTSTDDVVATLDGVTVCFDLNKRRARALPENIKAKLLEFGANPL